MNSILAKKLLGLYYRDGHDYRIPFGALRGLSLRHDPSINFHAYGAQPRRGPALIKMDIEGGRVLALRGTRRN